MIPKSYCDGVDPSRCSVIEKLVQDIPPKGFVDVNSDDYDLNKCCHGKYMKIHFVPTEIPAGKSVQKGKEIPAGSGTVRLEQLNDAAYPNGVEVAKVEEVLFHYQLKDEKIYLDYEKGGKVEKVPGPPNEESTKIVRKK